VFDVQFERHSKEVTRKSVEKQANTKKTVTTKHFPRSASTLEKVFNIDLFVCQMRKFILPNDFALQFLPKD